MSAGEARTTLEMTRQPASPSGEQYEITFGTHRVVITEVGAGLRSYTVDGRDVIDGYDRTRCAPPAEDRSSHPGRTASKTAPTTSAVGATNSRSTKPEAHNAIHGLVRWHAWTVRDHQPEHIALEHRLHPRPGYPFTLDLTVEYTLSDAGLTVRTYRGNTGGDACPVRERGTSVSHARQHRRRPDAPVPAHTVLHSDSRGPSDGRGQRGRDGVRLPSGTSHRQHGPRPLLHRSRPRRGRHRTGRAARADRDEGIDLWVDRSYPYLMFFTGDPLPDVARRALSRSNR